METTYSSARAHLAKLMDDYELQVLNLGPERDTFSFQVFLAPATQ